MKFQLVLLSLVVLFVSLPSVVFAQLPLSAVQSEETSEAAPKVETVKKSWEGPVFGLGFGLGLGRASLETFGYGDVSVGSPLVGQLPIRARLGYGLSESTVLYGGIGAERGLGADAEGNEPYGVLGMMFRRRWSDYYGFFALGTTRAIDRGRAFVFRGGSGIEVHPGLSVEAACAIRYLSLENASRTSVVLDLTFNYHFY